VLLNFDAATNAVAKAKMRQRKEGLKNIMFYRVENMRTKKREEGVNVKHRNLLEYIQNQKGLVFISCTRSEFFAQRQQAPNVKVDGIV